MHTQKWILALAAAAALLVTTTLPAATITWDGGAGGTGTSWNDAVNWAGDVKPGSEDIVTFNATGLTSGKILALNAPQVITRLSLPDWAGSPAFTIGNAADVASGNTLTLASLLRAANNVGDLTLAANVVLSTNSVWEINAGTTTMNGSISGTGRSLAKWGGGTLNLVGANGYTGDTSANAGTLSLRAANAYTGATLVNGGTFQLDFNTATGPAADIVPAASLLTTGGGTLNLNGRNSAAAKRSQTFNNLTVNVGASAFTIVNTLSTAFTRLSLGAISHTTGSTLNLSQPTVNTTLGADNGYTTGAANDASGILGAYLTVASANWAANNGVNIVAYTAYTDLAGATPPIVDGPNTNVRFDNASTGDIGQAAGTVTVNTLLAKGSTPRIVTIGAGNTLRLAAVGGILTPASTGALTLGAPGNAGTLTAGGVDNAPGELVFVNATTITNNATIANNGSGAVALTKSGGGTLYLPGQHTYTGGTFVNGGTVLLSAGTDRLANTGVIAVNGGTLDLGTSSNNVSASVTFRGGAVTNGTITKTGANFDAQSGTIFASLTGSVGLEKTTPAALYLKGPNTYTGDTTIREGSVLGGISAAGKAATIAVNGNLVVGSPQGGLPAYYGQPGVYPNYVKAFNSSKNVTIYPNGSVDFGAGDQYMVGGTTITIIGGSFTAGQFYNWATVNMTGGSFGGSIYGANFNFNTSATSTTAIVSAYLNLSHTFTVADGSVPIDLLYSGGHGGTGKTLTKAGAGVMAMTGTGRTYTGSMVVNGGTLLANNTAGSCVGNAAVTVNAGTTLGGTGFIGGVSTYTAANVTATGTVSSLAVLAPGSIHATTGDHIVGTLTVGSATQSNNVTFNNHSKLRVTLGTNGVGDRLTVNGTLSLATANDTLEIVVPDGAKPGTYILASATGGITGSFNNTIMPSSGMTLNQNASTIELTVNPTSTLVLVR